jgi:hypothetical protein
MAGRIPKSGYGGIFDMPADAELTEQYVTLFTKAAMFD